VPSVWIVDDDDEMSHAVKLMLELLEFQVQTFRDARTASRQLLAGHHPDVLLLDINMPEVTGIDMLEFVRRRRELAVMPVVMLSSETTDVQVDEAMSLGANGYVFKPVTIDELETVLDKVLPGRKA
jgi:DNA-binding response OmpR family regulator